LGVDAIGDAASAEMGGVADALEVAALTRTNAGTGPFYRGARATRRARPAAGEHTRIVPARAAPWRWTGCRHCGQRQMKQEEGGTERECEKFFSIFFSIGTELFYIFRPVS